MEAFLAALRNKSTLGHIVALLPPPTTWTSDFIAGTRAGLAVMRSKGLDDVAAAIEKLVMKEEPPDPDVQMADAATAADTDSESLEDAYFRLPAPGASAEAEQDRQIALSEAKEKVAVLSASYHIAKFAPRYFQITESR